jgi:hypothetical protein
MKSRHPWILRILFAVLLAWPILAGAQSLPRLTPIPPHGRAQHLAALHTNASPSSSPWTPLTNQPNFSCGGPPNSNGAANPILLTDGSVLIQDAGCQDWLKLTPDNSGSYVNGTLSSIAPLPSNYSPLYHSSAYCRTAA